MSKEKKNTTQTEVVLVPEKGDAPVVDNASSQAPVSGPPNPKLMDVDKMALDLAKERRLTALAEAKTAMAKNDNAELAFKYIVLQIYMKYGLNEADAISETGEIIKNGALPQGQ